MFSVSVAEDRSSFVGLSFRVTKHEGAAFWEEAFPKQLVKMRTLQVVREYMPRGAVVSHLTGPGGR